MGSRSGNSEQTRRTRRVAVIVGGIVPLVIAVVSTAIMVSWLSELPSPVATHWGATGGPDGYGSVWITLVLPLLFSLAFGAIAVGASWGTRPSGLLSGTQKILLATNLFLAGMISTLALWTLAVQRGLSDASQAPGITPGALAAAAVGLVLAAAGWFLLPRTDNSFVDIEDTEESSTGESGTEEFDTGESGPEEFDTGESGTGEPGPPQLGPSDQPDWSRSIRIAGGVLALLGAVVVVLCAVLIVPFWRSSEGPVIPVVVLVFVVLVAVGTSFWRVRVGHRGLMVRSVLGWPRFTIRPGDIRSVRVVQINPIADFGGWGWRWVGGRRVGVIMRAGEAIEVTRQSGSVFVVTVDDAETGVTLLAALVAQAQTGAHATGS